MPGLHSASARLLAAMLQVAILAAASAATAAEPREFDILLRGGDIIDGSGAPRYRADIGIVGDEIVAIGRFPEAKAGRVIDASGRVVTPGFIDMHSHAADGGDHGKESLHSQDPKRRAAQNFVAQGITTGVVNPDGNQPDSLDKQREQMQRDGIGINVLPMNGHSGLRRVAMKSDIARAATADEIRLMQQQLAHDLASGESFGMSLGVEYDGARHSSTQEQIALGEVLAAYNGVFIPHLRSQGISPMWYRPSQNKDTKPPTLDDSIDETLRVAEETGAIVVFTHLKAWGPGYRSEAARVVKRLQDARDRGARVYMDVYPYDSSGSDGDFVALPSWIFGKQPPAAGKKFDYRAAFEKNWSAADATKRKDLELDVRHQIALKGGVENVRILNHPRADYIGKTYAELMKLRGLDELQLSIALQREGDRYRAGGAHMRSFSMDENDIAKFYSLDWCAVSTDGWVVLPEEAVGDKKYVETNRRLFGSVPQRLAYFSQQRGVDTLEHAVRAGTGLPAQILSLRDRGGLAPGMKADIAVFDMAKLKDNTTYIEPSVYPSGVDYVLVNGRFAVDGGKRTAELHGRVLQRKGDKR
jgi:N-acyl-D-amino-acid deacylase